MAPVSLLCNQCGASIEVPESASFIVCNACNTHLAVKRTETITYTEAIHASAETSSDSAETTPVSSQADEADTASVDSPSEVEIQNESTEVAMTESLPESTSSQSESAPTIQTSTAVLESPSTNVGHAPVVRTVADLPPLKASPLMVPSGANERDLWRQALISMDNEWEQEKHTYNVGGGLHGGMNRKSIVLLTCGWIGVSALLIAISFTIWEWFGWIAIAVCVTAGIALFNWILQASEDWQDTNRFQQAERRYQERRQALLNKLASSN
ncbi:hypothetical protein [Calycomorphotria hydatis]|uniref:Uncharacterized protein n=1 Tax=Calycomorphotria hydatis TaxID=2528027 RepID=A0A517T524_9PLAN|nr:hypothetical protein [Calycomorphotria hydatis]QDT63470.1 hypothetical protein V22_06920 [Calycomorphotria hydatis]